MGQPDEIAVFETNAQDYDRWFDKHPDLYEAEIRALQRAVPKHKKGIEIGVGTGRFASALDIRHGVEPAENMANIAEQRGIHVTQAKAEYLPFDAGAFDFVLMVTTVCFLADLQQPFREAHRILKDQGTIILGIIDKDSYLGKQYNRQKSNDPYYRHAHFHTTKELAEILKSTGFDHFEYWQTLMEPGQNTGAEVQEGFGKGGFVVIKANKVENSG